jgi:hypothetical protein
MLRLRQEELLLTELRAAFASTRRGFTAHSERPSEVLILSRGHFCGIWRCRDGEYAFTPGGFGPAMYVAASAEEAVYYTLEHVCRDARECRAAV